MNSVENISGPVALVCLGAAGIACANRLKPLFSGAEIFGLKGRASGGADVVFENVGDLLRRLFAGGRPVVGICAAGILVRAVAPMLNDKSAEPPLIAVSDDGDVVVPLLGGHRGANRMAKMIAAETGGIAAITTASDRQLGFALDDPPQGWRVANPAAAKAVTADLLAGKPVRLDVQAGDGDWPVSDKSLFDPSGHLGVIVTDRAIDDAGDDLVLHPPVLCVGVGCERDTEPDEVIALVERTLADASLAPGAVGNVVSLDLKADEDAVHAVAKHLDVPARFFAADTLEAQTPHLANPSDVVFRAVGCHGVAEGAALAAAGDGGELIVEKTGSKRATCAVARAPRPLNAATIGHARGQLSIIGIGPGSAEWRTPEATRAIMAADDVVGYGLYLDLIGDLTTGKEIHQSNLSEEEIRVRKALDLAAGGRRVALVCSGDAGIYALATLAMELLDFEDRGDWNRIQVTVMPGVSAFQAAAARLGAPVGHDFCTVSLSDLLTPWPVIERRLRAAAAGDFVVALYNPVSRRRREHLAHARDILLAHRPPETPVALARNLGRDNETITVIKLGDLTTDHADMLTLVMIGNKETRTFTRGGRCWVYTPRGYAGKITDST